jgi:hypothetical protein
MDSRCCVALAIGTPKMSALVACVGENVHDNEET